MRIPSIVSARVTQRYSESNVILVEITFDETRCDLIKGNTVSIPVQNSEEDWPNEPHELG
jgi:hypothetical protein